jgi:methyltransferase (TIGR00027 family)
MATTAENPLIDDPFAEPLVRAVGVDFFSRLVTGDLRPEDLDSDTESVGMQRMADSMAVRTKFFDEFFLGATEAGIQQAVILASGLDSRAYRLAWPAGTTVYEIDQPEVIEFKTRTLAHLGAEPTANRRTVAIDLRYDWPSALIEEGFDPNQPTAWSAEGLLGYLPPDAQDRLLDTITELSAPGSRVAVESVPNIDASDHEKAIERMRQASERWRDHGFDLDFGELVYLGDRNEAASYLGDHGWQLSRSSAKELFAANGLPPLPEDDEDVGNFSELQYVSGVLGAQR